MSVIIRLQNLPWSANALDIRQYFRGLSIPEGGVHIVGGELGDAFIAFSTDEDARQAFQLNNGKIKEVQIKLLLSSRTEMQKVIEAARTAPFMQAVIPQPAAIPSPAIIPQVLNHNQQISVHEKKDDKDSKTSKDDTKSRSRDRDRGRRRSRSHSRSRDRKDRSRDRRDRRRRDRSRSRDRRDRRRDRRRSRSRDRTRSRDRDSRRSRDEKRDSHEPANKIVDGVIEIKDDVPNIRVWDKSDMQQTTDIKPQQPGLLGNYPANLDDNRRNVGIVSGLQNNRVPRNDINPPTANRDWQRKSRFQDSNEMSSTNQFNQNSLLIRPNMNQNLNMGMGSNIFNAIGMRLPLQSDNFGMSGPFLPRSDTVFPNQNQFRNQDRQFNPNDRSDESFRNDRNKMNCCVQLHPYYGGYGEVRKFFHGLYISNTGVKFVAENGKRNGVVYIKFVRPDGKDQALARSGMILRGVSVEVSHLDDEDWERYGENDHSKADDQIVSRKDTERLTSPHQLQHFTCVVVDDLPEFAKEHDILKLFSDYAILSVHMIMSNQYHQLAYVQFSKEEDAQNAVTDKKLHVIGGKPVTVRPIADEAFNDILHQQENDEMNLDSGFGQNDNLSTSQSNIPSHIITDCVMLTGLPHKTSDRDVLDFFSDIGIVPLRIHIMMNKFGPTGECFCEFANPDEAVCAIDKNAMPLGTGTVRVELYPRRDMERALGIHPSNAVMNQGPRFPNRFGPRGPNILGPRPPPNMMRRRPLGPNMHYDGPIDTMGPPGCIVTMENVPFKAGVDEILDFFGNFELVSHNVFRRFNDNGAPTGDARVTFNSPAEAHRAVEECNKLKIRDRTIYLRVL